MFDLIYVDGYDLRRVALDDRKRVLREILIPNEMLRYSDHYAGEGVALFNAAKQKSLEGILAKKCNSCYEERRSREWLKIKITQTVDCVVGGYTDPDGARQYFGSLVLGLYDNKGLLSFAAALLGLKDKKHLIEKVGRLLGNDSGDTLRAAIVAALPAVSG